MKRASAALLSAGIGAGVMYLMDPARGRRRRAVLRDQMNHASRKALGAMDMTARDLSNRTRGLFAELRAMGDDEPVGDEVLRERVRSALGRSVTHPHAVEVKVVSGRVSLSGPILADEVQRLLRRVAAVRGVQGVDNQLEVHQEPGNVPGLQGALTRANRGHLEYMQANWSPAARLAAGAAGAAAGLYGLRRQGLLSKVLAASGLALLTRAATNLEYRRLFGVGAGRRSIDVQKTIHINAPVERVFELWTRYENFPHFMSHVQRVERIDDTTSRWVVSGPGGVPIEWEAELVSLVPNELLAWRSRPNSALGSAGIVRFYGDDADRTTVDIKLTYNPVAGAAGHAVLSLLGRDPRHQLNDDLLRMKTFIETGTPPRDAAQPPPTEALH